MALSRSGRAEDLGATGVDPAAPAPGRTPLGLRLAELAAEGPDRPALTCGDVMVTRAELERRTNRLARAYRERGVTPGSFVTIALPTGLGFLEAVIATWKLGATPQPVSHRLPERELAAIVELADPVLVVGLPVAGRRHVSGDLAADETLSDRPLDAVVAPSLKAPTSGGSTGRPKLIVSTDEATVEALAPLGLLMGIRPDGTALSTGPLSHNAPLLTSTAAIFLGCHVVVMERFDARDALDLVERHRVDWMYSVPTMLSRIAALPPDLLDWADVTSLRTVITMAASCSESLRWFCLGFFGPDTMLELYAATEAQVVVTIDGHGWAARPGSVGRVVLGELQVRDETGALAPPGQVGELWVRRGPDHPAPYRYVGSTPQRDDQGWETVGDLGRLDDEGWLYLADRKTDMVVVGGSNVYPAEVENALEEHPDVEAACVVGVPDGEYGAVVHAVLNVRGPVSDDELRRHLASRVVTYKQPRTFERVTTPLRDEAGKLRRGRVAEESAARAGSRSGERG